MPSGASSPRTCSTVGAANNLPLAAAIALIPIVIIFGYLALVRRTGALNNL